MNSLFSPIDETEVGANTNALNELKLALKKGQILGIHTREVQIKIDEAFEALMLAQSEAAHAKAYERGWDGAIDEMRGLLEKMEQR